MNDNFEVNLLLFFLDDQFNYVMKVQYNSLHSCPRCRLQNSEKENELCLRCFSYSQKS